MHLDNIQNKNNVSNEEIDDIILGVGAFFEATAKETFGSINMKKKKSKTVKSHVKPWVSVESSWARNMYNKFKTDYYKNILIIVSKNIGKLNHITTDDLSKKKIMNCDHLNTSIKCEYCKIINSHKKGSNSQASPDEFY